MDLDVPVKSNNPVNTTYLNNMAKFSIPKLTAACYHLISTSKSKRRADLEVDGALAAKIVGAYMNSKLSFQSILSLTAKSGIGALSKAEKLLLRNYVGLRDPSITVAPAGEEDQHATEEGQDWGDDRKIRSKLIFLLCADKNAIALGVPSGLIVSGARIFDKLDLRAILVQFPIILDNCYFDQTPLLNEVRALELYLGGSSAPGLQAGGADIKLGLSLNGFRSRGETLNLATCRIGGDLDCGGANLLNSDRYKDGSFDDSSGRGLDAYGAIIGGNVFLRSTSEGEFRTDGAINFTGSQIAGDFDCTNGTFAYPPSKSLPASNSALKLENVNVKGSILLQNGFSAEGEVSLQDAQIGGSLICDGGRFKNPLSDKETMFSALMCERITVGGTVRLAAHEKYGRFQTIGYIELRDARIGGILEMGGADLKSATLDLSGATASGLSDNGDISWPRPDHLYLKRFEYGAIVGGTEDSKDRLRWLRLQPQSDFNYESYSQLAKVLLAAGDDEGAHFILEELSRLQAKRGHPFWFLKPEVWLKAPIGYGYRPILAFWYMLSLGSLGWIIYRRSYLAGSLAPVDEVAYDAFCKKKALPGYYPGLSSLVLSVENSLPLVKLGMADKWQPNPSGCPPVPVDEQLRAPENLPKVFPRTAMFSGLRNIGNRIGFEVGLTPGSNGVSKNSAASRFATSPKFVRRFMWIQILLGWLLATAFVAGVGGLFKK
ncbi:hypothetical protein [Granulicella sibirica]|uniref:hypothetical protein n=1 Tax=Granulicella sibirica TaxID=2479048 RepID=UPI001008A1ED|nr:hypothetical protein [Granulicella sibirica]